MSVRNDGIINKDMKNNDNWWLRGTVVLFWYNSNFMQLKLNEIIGNKLLKSKKLARQKSEWKQKRQKLPVDSPQTANMENGITNRAKNNF